MSSQMLHGVRVIFGPEWTRIKKLAFIKKEENSEWKETYLCRGHLWLRKPGDGLYLEYDTHPCRPVRRCPW